MVYFGLGAAGAEALHALGLLHCNGNGVLQDFPKSKTFLKGLPTLALPMPVRPWLCSLGMAWVNSGSPIEPSMDSQSSGTGQAQRHAQVRAAV